ncbi:MAG TPA: elongation factor G, partial [Desulfocapsa sulfexigens]|nr:elongation factor G [Desulfocapsa sulfexigens]
DDGIMEKFLDDTSVSATELHRALRTATLNLDLVPVLCGSAFKNKGIQPLLDSIIHYLPSPLDVPPMIGIGKKGEEISRKANAKEKFSALIFKLMSDAFVENLAFIRIYSGVLKVGDKVFNPVKKKKEKINKLIRLHANKREEVDTLQAGDIGAVIGLKFSTTGDTLCASGDFIVLESMEFPEPVIGIAIEAKSKADEKKLKETLDRIGLEDPSFKITKNEDTGQTIISGMGELHLEIIVDRLLNEFKVNANVGTPQVSYKETISATAEGEGKFDQQTGAKGQYGHVVIRVEPLERSEGVIFESLVEESQIPSEFLGAIEKGIRDSLDAGPLIGYPVTDIKVSLIGGSYIEDESTEMAFGISSAMAISRVTADAEPLLLEPIMSLEILCPDEYLGEMMNDLNSKGAQVIGVETNDGLQVVRAHAPLAQLFGYSTSLRSATQGRANFTMQFEKYDVVQNARANEIIRKIRGI